MLQRAITGAIFVAVLVGAIYLGGYYFHVLFGIIALVSLNEFYNLFPKKKLSPNTGFGLLIGMLLYVMASWTISYNLEVKYLLGVLILSFPLLAFAELYRKHKSPFQNIGVTILGWVYIILPLVLLHQLMWNENMEDWSNYLPVLSVFILVWTSDTFAYLVGKNFGKHKLFVRISPNKSWEGFIGGLVFASLVGYIIALISDSSPVFYIGLGIMIASIGTLGDLVESMLKRSLGIKDSGTILPGHGGLLDRIDAVLYVIPVVYLYFIIQ
ncbi:MAG: phosphatidate cytidylyltransferase [Crocinitomicaceae bacterium]